MMGRPRSITKETAETLLTYCAEGMFIREACLKAKVSFDSVCRLRLADENFRNRLACACETGAFFRLDDAGYGLKTTGNKYLTRSMAYAHHCRWIASCVVPGYRKRLELVAAPPPLHPTESQKLVTIEHARRLAFAMARGAHLAEQQRTPRLPVLIEHSPSTEGVNASRETGNQLED
jgi:hypothetical protein